MHVKHYCSAYRSEWWLLVRGTKHCCKGHLQLSWCCRGGDTVGSHMSSTATTLQNVFHNCIYLLIFLKKTKQNPKLLVPGISAKREIWKSLSFDFQRITLYMAFVSQFCLHTYAHQPAWYLWRCHLYLISVFALPDLISWSLLVSPPHLTYFFCVLALVSLHFFWT